MNGQGTLLLFSNGDTYTGDFSNGASTERELTNPKMVGFMRVTL